MHTRVILVRHGESTFNVLSMVQGRGNLERPELQSVLTERGQQQARLAGSALQNLTLHGIYVSPLVRAQQTAELLCQAMPSYLPRIPHPDLMEVDLREWEGMTFDQVKAAFPEDYAHWRYEAHQLRLGDRFPIMDLLSQARRFWDQVLPKHQGQTLLLVAHSGINRALICAALGLPPQEYHRIQQANGGISVLNFRGDRVQLESANLTTHLAPLLGSVLPPPRKQQQGCRLLLVRHGETDWNRQQRFQGQRDIPLNDQGRLQARRAAEFLKEVPIHCAFSSPLSRSLETAQQILSLHSQVPLTQVPALQEISHGTWEGKLESELRAIDGELLERWQSQPEVVQMPEGENLDQVWDRVRGAWEELVAKVPPQQTALVVAHDAVNKAILCQLFDRPPAAFWMFKQGNGSVTVIDLPRGDDHPPLLQALNITAHLEQGVLDRTAAGAL